MCRDSKQIVSKGNNTTQAITSKINEDLEGKETHLKLGNCHRAEALWRISGRRAARVVFQPRWCKEWLANT